MYVKCRTYYPFLFYLCAINLGGLKHLFLKVFNTTFDTWLLEAAANCGEEAPQYFPRFGG